MSAASARRPASYICFVNRRQQKRKQARRVQHAQETRTPDRPILLFSGADCSKVNNGHIVPRTYQRAWEGEDRQVSVHEEGNSACRLKSTKIAGARGPYYRRKRPRQGTETDDIEASLAYFEDKATPALRQVVDGKPITAERKAALAQFFGVQLMRGPAFFDQHEEIQRSVLEGADADDFKPRLLVSRLSFNR